VITTNEEAEESQKKGDITAAWAGGENGTHTLRTFLPQVPVLFFCSMISFSFQSTKQNSMF
jgi:hypothetical protein